MSPEQKGETARSRTRLLVRHGAVALPSGASFSAPVRDHCTTEHPNGREGIRSRATSVHPVQARIGAAYDHSAMPRSTCAMPSTEIELPCRPRIARDVDSRVCRAHSVGAVRGGSSPIAAPRMQDEQRAFMTRLTHRPVMTAASRRRNTVQAVGKGRGRRCRSRWPRRARTGTRPRAYYVNASSPVGPTHTTGLGNARSRRRTASSFRFSVERRADRRRTEFCTRFRRTHRVVFRRSNALTRQSAITIARSTAAASRWSCAARSRSISTCRSGRTTRGHQVVRGTARAG